MESDVQKTEAIASNHVKTPSSAPQADAVLDNATLDEINMSPLLRKALLAFSLTGFLETAFLTYNKLFGTPANICQTQGCFDVLTGPYSSVLGIPLSLIGTVAYGAFAFLAGWPLTASEEEEILDAEAGTTRIRSAEEVRRGRDAATRPLMLALSTCMLMFSSYLMSLLTIVIRSTCPYCIFSATLATIIFFLTAVVSKAVSQWKSAVAIIVGSAGVTAVAAMGAFVIATPGGLRAQIPSEPQAPPAITQPSTGDSMRAAKKLAKHNTKMYGAYWCTHCYDQKQRFGKKAFEKIKYVECDRYGVDSKAKLCRQKRIPGYPTWEIAGQLYPGEIEIQELERLADEAEP